jgi:molybdopterin-guanine dinucleotide biosynthesis protein A
VIPLTGILLVGGASSRFGSPKALARFRGETLAERCHRLLAAACDEVLVVGKAGELGGLPFSVVDDGTPERAPVHGLIAGLRHATHEVVVALPVDVPLVTPDALRALGAACAVPSPTVPLPGAYPRALLPALEARVAGGELSLRGVNPVTLPLPSAMLVDVDTPEALALLEAPA